MAAYNAIDDGVKGKLLCLVDALHDCYYACGYNGGEVIYPPAYLTEEQVLALAAEGYTLCACSPLPLQEKTPVLITDGTKGLALATKALAERLAFDELNALYIRKSSAEENLK